MENIAEKFLELIDKAIADAESVSKEASLKANTEIEAHAKEALNFLLGLKDDTKSGKLRRPSHGIGWGMARAVGEWGETTQLMESVDELEEFYRKNM